MMKLIVAAVLLCATASWALAPRTWTVTVGGEPDWHDELGGTPFMFIKFYPSKLTILQGDTVKWVLRGEEIHTITLSPMNSYRGLDLVEDGMGGFIGPIGGNVYNDPSQLYHSGVLAGPESGIPLPAEWSLQFNVTTTFPPIMYFCSVHSPQHRGWIEVLPASEVLEHTPESVLIDAAEEYAEDQWLASKLQETVVKPSLNQPGSWIQLEDGRKQHFVEVGWGVYPEGLDAFRFFPTWLQVEQGDLVTFTSSTSASVHTVAFNASGVFQPFGTPEWFPVSVPGTGPLPFTGQTFASNFIIAPAQAAINTVPTLLGITIPSFTISADAVGDWPFACHLHTSMGMKGWLRVVPHGHQDDHHGGQQGGGQQGPAPSTVVNVNFADLFNGLNGHQA